MMSKNDNKIKKLLGIIETRRNELGTKPRMSLKTNGLLKINDKYININTINSLNDCIHIVAEIVNFQAAATLLNINTIDMPKYNGFTIEEWIDDFKLKVKIILWTIEDKKIKMLELKLKDLRSEDLKTADALDDIANELE